MSVSRIPWEHRHEIGRFRAFWKTTRLVMFHPRRLAEEMNRPVDYPSARKFHFITVTLAWVAPAGWVAALIADSVRTGGLHLFTRLGSWLQTILIVSTFLAAWLFLFLATGVASYWFHPKTLSIPRQNRAVALSYYPCASLAWLWLAAALLVPVAFVDSAPRRLENAIFILAIIDELLILFLVLDWYSVSCLLMGAVTHCPPGRRWAFFLTLPLMWLACLLLSCLIPAAVFLISLMILSFR